MKNKNLTPYHRLNTEKACLTNQFNNTTDPATIEALIYRIKAIDILIQDEIKKRKEPQNGIHM